MPITLHHIAAALLLIISLVMPIACDAARLLDLVDSPVVAHTQLAADVSDGHCPCPECPFNHHCESDCCSSYAPLFQGLELDYAPTSACLSFFSIDSKPPQVYFSIFVPPQNHVA
jgi:hypothetical protein